MSEFTPEQVTMVREREARLQKAMDRFKDVPLPVLLKAVKAVHALSAISQDPELLSALETKEGEG